MSSLFSSGVLLPGARWRWEGCAIAGVEGGAKKKDSSDTADDLGEVGGLFGAQGAVEQGRGWLGGELAVAEPLLEDLVSAEGVVPNMDGNGGPVGVAVEVDFDAGFAQESQSFVGGE